MPRPDVAFATIVAGSNHSESDVLQSPVGRYIYTWQRNTSHFQSHRAPTPLMSSLMPADFPLARAGSFCLVIGRQGLKSSEISTLNMCHRILLHSILYHLLSIIGSYRFVVCLPQFLIRAFFQIQFSSRTIFNHTSSAEEWTLPLLLNCVHHHDDTVSPNESSKPFCDKKSFPASSL